MGQSQLEEKLAVESGYWQLYRYNPTLADEGKNPFTLDSKEPDWDKFQEFIRGEVRYSSLLKTFPDQAKELFALTEQHAKTRYQNYKRLAE
jgi:pyruvate-ferredoxin/flavodoxin oxidoreductase